MALFIVDFVCLEKMLVIEVDGAVHGGLDGVQRDNERTGHLNSKGYRVIRFHNREVLEDLPIVLRRIRHALASPDLGTEGASDPP